MMREVTTITALSMAALSGLWGHEDGKRDYELYDDPFLLPEIVQEYNQWWDEEHKDNGDD